MGFVRKGTATGRQPSAKIEQTNKPKTVKKIVAKKAAKPKADPKLAADLKRIAALPQTNRKIEVRKTTEPATAWVRKSNYANGVMITEQTEDIMIAVPNIEGPAARTKVALGCTKSMGGFEFVRIDVSVELPCHPNPIDLDETNLFASQKALEYMERELASIPEAPEPQQHQTNVSALLHD